MVIEIKVSVPDNKADLEIFLHTVFGAWLMAKTNKDIPNSIMIFYDDVMFECDKVAQTVFTEIEFKEIKAYQDGFFKTFNLKGFKDALTDITDKFLDDLDN